jgi:hypothetical protein
MKRSFEGKNEHWSKEALDRRSSAAKKRGRGGKEKIQSDGRNDLQQDFSLQNPSTDSKLKNLLVSFKLAFT